MKPNLNIEFLSQTLNEELIKKSKLIKTNEYTIGAITSRGTNVNRNTNQDYSAIALHSKDDNISMMILADGKDEAKNSDLATQILVETLCLWFKRLSKREANTAMILEAKLLGELRKLNLDLYRYYNPSKTSFALALKGKKETFIANVGNCRCYTINGDEISLQTTDNLVWYDYNEPSLITPDEVKFLYSKDYVSRTIGGHDNSKRYFEPYVSIVNNNDFDSLVLTTHGVTDVLDSKEIKTCVIDNNIDIALDKIISKTLYSDPKQLPQDLLDRFTEENNQHMLIEKTIPGDSNATAIVYKKTK